MSKWDSAILKKRQVKRDGKELIKATNESRMSCFSGWEEILLSLSPSKNHCIQLEEKPLESRLRTRMSQTETLSSSPRSNPRRSDFIWGRACQGGCVYRRVFTLGVPLDKLIRRRIWSLEKFSTSNPRSFSLCPFGLPCFCGGRRRNFDPG